MSDNPYTNQFRLDGKRAVLIGAGGIGREIAPALAAHGAYVICADKDVETPKGTAAALDVTDPHAVDQAARDAGEVDVLVLTAAMNVRKRILDYSLEEFDRVVGLNLRATFSVVQAFGRTMVERGRGSIIVFSSIRGYMVEPGQSVYAATKAGAIQLVKTAAVEFGESG